MAVRILGGEGERRRRLRLLLPVVALAALVLLAVGGPAVVQVTSASAAPSNIEPKFVSFTLAGCRNDGTITLPDVNGKFTCPDATYTSGNLGKGWNELDLVPHRLTTSLGSQATATETYDVFLAADNTVGGKVGYDILSTPQLNTPKSHASCQILDVGAQTNGGAVTGGADNVIYRSVTLDHDKGTTCVLDYVIRLALGAAQYSGSSLQSYMFEKSDLSTGKRTIPIPVKDILPQELRKDMTATRDADHVWNLTKGATPATVSFGDVCDTGFTNTKGVEIKIEWTRGPATPSGQATIITNIYAKNPAARIVTVNVTDKIYEGTTQTTLLDTASSGDIDVPANTELLVLTHQVSVPSAATQFNDVATATYKDKIFPDVAIPGQTTATASATVQTGTTTNQSATITDSESISGSGLAFAVATPSVGAFTGAPAYVAGTYTTGPVAWSSGTQSGSGSVDFSKTIKLDPKQVTTGTLSDSASLSGSNGATASAALAVDVASTATVKLTINKSIPNVLQTGESVTFGFDIIRDLTVVTTASVTFVAGDTSKSVDVTGLAPGSYTVHEQTPPTPWTQQSDQNVTIGVPACAGSVSFANGFAPAAAQAKKITDPSGSEAGWKLKLSGPGTPVNGEEITTTGAGFLGFATALQEGSYTIAETGQTGWDLTGAAASGGATGGTSSCTFTVDYPGDAGKLYGCAFTNVQRGKIIVKKETNPDGSTQSFTFDPSYGADFILKDGESNDSGLLVPGTYSVSETVPAGWDLTPATCDDSSAVSAIALGAGETVTCTFTNTQRGKAKVIKTVDGAAPSGTQSFTFQLRQGATPTQNGTTLESVAANAGNGGVVLLATNLLPGSTYQLCEIVMPGWTTTLGTFVPGSFMPPDGVAANPNVDNSILCVNFTVTAGQTKEFTVDNSPPPGGRALTIGFWKNWSSCSGGNQRPVLDQTLAAAVSATSNPPGGLVVSAQALGSGWPNFAPAYYLVLRTNPAVEACQRAVSLLNKSTFDGKKKASDPLFNMTAQLVAAELNYFAGAGKNGSTTTNIGSAVVLNGKYAFSGSGYSGKLSTADAAKASCLATQLDNYNNNRAVSTCT